LTIALISRPLSLGMTEVTSGLLSSQAIATLAGVVSSSLSDPAEDGDDVCSYCVVDRRESQRRPPSVGSFRKVARRERAPDHYTEPPVPGRAPEFNGHGAAILEELGIDTDTIIDLKVSGVAA
jgi:hypothetical protein